MIWIKKPLLNSSSPKIFKFLYTSFGINSCTLMYTRSWQHIENTWCAKSELPKNCTHCTVILCSSEKYHTTYSLDIHRQHSIDALLWETPQFIFVLHEGKSVKSVIKKLNKMQTSTWQTIYTERNVSIEKIFALLLCSGKK